jgi:hypothetical protein
MNKKYYFIFTLLLVFLMVFSLAVTCRFCSIPDFKASGNDSTEETENNGNQPDASQNSDNDETPDTDDDADVGNPPQIITVFYMDDDMTEFLEREALPVLYASGEHDFIIIAQDEDGEEMNFDINEEHGEVVNIERADNESVSFTWISPDNVEGSIDPLSTKIKVTVRDASGNEDLFNISIALLPALDMEPVEPADEGEDRRETVSIAADSALSGYIIKDTEVRTGVVMVGDWTNNKQIKGYLTFDLSDFGGFFSDAVINEVMIRFTHINKSGSPELISDMIDFKAFNYGDSLDAGDFAVGGTHFISVGTGVFAAGSAEFGSSTLESQIQAAVSAGQEKFQVKMGLTSATDNDGVSDLFQCHPETVFLDIDYSY